MLYVHYEDQRVAVEGDRFVIGRGATAALRISSPSVARAHAVVELAGGRHWQVDLSSTCGVRFAGELVSRRAIEDGDRFEIGDRTIEFRFG